MNITEFVQSNGTMILALLITWVAVQAAVAIFRQKVDLVGALTSLGAAALVFWLLTSYGGSFLAKGYTNAKQDLAGNAILIDLGGMTGIKVAPAQQYASASTTTQVSQAQTVQPAQAEAVQVVAPAPERVAVLRDDALARAISTLATGNRASADVAVINGQTQARSIPQGVTCIIYSGANLMKRAGEESWPMSCVHGNETASRSIDGNWGRHYAGDAENITVTGVGPWPEVSYKYLVREDPQVTITPPQVSVAAAVDSQPAAVVGNVPQAAPTAPAPTPAPAPTIFVDSGVAVLEATHTVARGDSLSIIAKRYWNDAEKWRDLCAWNNLKNCSALTVGMVLRLEAP